jgi:hypothetical protein
LEFAWCAWSRVLDWFAVVDGRLVCWGFWMFIVVLAEEGGEARNNCQFFGGFSRQRTLPSVPSGSGTQPSSFASLRFGQVYFLGNKPLLSLPSASGISREHNPLASLRYASGTLPVWAQPFPPLRYRFGHKPLLSLRSASGTQSLAVWAPFSSLRYVSGTCDFSGTNPCYRFAHHRAPSFRFGSPRGYKCPRTRPNRRSRT